MKWFKHRLRKRINEMLFPTALDFAGLHGDVDFNLLPRDKVSVLLRKLADEFDAPIDKYPRITLAEVHSTQSARFFEYSTQTLVTTFKRHLDPAEVEKKRKALAL